MSYCRFFERCYQEYFIYINLGKIQFSYLFNFYLSDQNYLILLKIKSLLIMPQKKKHLQHKKKHLDYLNEFPKKNEFFSSGLSELKRKSRKNSPMQSDKRKTRSTGQPSSPCLPTRKSSLTYSPARTNFRPCVLFFSRSLFLCLSPRGRNAIQLCLATNSNVTDDCLGLRRLGFIAVEGGRFGMWGTIYIQILKSYENFCLKLEFKHLIFHQKKFLLHLSCLFKKKIFFSSSCND